MTVKDLINKLVTFPQDMEIRGHTLGVNDTANVIDIAIIGNAVHIIKQ